MGGAIVTLIAETAPEGYDGLLALGAALQVRDAEQPHEWSYTPRLPLLFLSNQNESEGPQSYIQKAVKAPSVPVFWSVARDGHVNLREIERETALRALDAYLDTGAIERDKDATIAPDHVSSAEFVEGGAYTKIESISSTYGNINTEFIESDLQQLGISSQNPFSGQLWRADVHSVACHHLWRRTTGRVGCIPDSGRSLEDCPQLRERLEDTWV